MKLLDHPFAKKTAWRLAMLAALLLFVGLLKPDSASAAALTAGDLIKLPSDNSAATTHDSAVYYYGADGKRYVFPNAQTYRTWYADFSGVKEISAAELAAIPVGGNVTYRPGTRLVKITSDPKVYAVEPGGLLRPIPSEAVAQALYGNSWNQRIDDVPDAFFFSYTIGSPLSAAVYPDGSVVRRQSDGAVFLIDGAVKRRIASVNVLESLRVQDQYILETSGDLSGYPESTTVSSAEADIIDTSQQNLTAEPAPTDGNGDGNGDSTPPPAQTTDTMEVTATSAGGNQTVVRGAQKVTVNGFTFKATADIPNVIKSVTVQGYVDEEGAAGFLPGADADNGTVTRVRDVVPRVYLYSGATLLAGPVDVDTGGQAVFSGLAVSVAADASVTLRVVGDTDPDAQLEQVADRVMFDVSDAAEDVTVTDSAGGPVTAEGELPNGGNEAVTYLTVRPRGKLELKWTGGSGPVVAGRDQRLGEMYFETEYDSYDLKTIAFRFETVPQSLPGPLTLEYPKADGTSGTTTAELIGNTVVFNSLPARLSGSGKLYLWGKVLARESGAVYEEQLKLSFSPESGLHWVSLTDGSDFSADDLNGEFQLTKNQQTGWYVRYSELTVAVAADSPLTVYRSYPEEVLRFELTAADEGPVRVKKMVFELKPNDYGHADQDSLEYWAQINGDAPDDDGIADLYWLSPSGNDILIGEGGSGELDYYIVRGSTVMSDPVSQGYVSASGDYARIVYVLNQELTIPAGTTYLMSYQLDTTGFQATSDRLLDVRLMGGSDFQWTDIPYGAYTPLTGGNASGVPFTRTVTVKFY